MYILKTKQHSYHNSGEHAYYSFSFYIYDLIALLCMAPDHGLDYFHLFNCQNCRYLHPSASSRSTSSSTSVLVAAVCVCGADNKCLDSNPLNSIKI